MKKKYLTKMLISVLFVLSCFIMGICSFGASEIETSTSTDSEDFNLIMMIDKSGSMKDTDKTKLVKDAAKLFIDLCESTGESQIAVMSFNTGTDSSGLFRISLDENKKQLKEDFVEQIEYTGDTDIGSALNKAMKMLKADKVNQNTPKKNLVLLFTDGKTEFTEANGYSEEEARLAEEKSIINLQEALETAKEIGCRIYIIGTNYDNSMDSQGQLALYEIRDQQIANGVPNEQDELLTIINAKDQDGMSLVVDEFKKIYASIGNRIIHTGDIIVESPNVTEVNIVITAPEGISAARITSPGNKTVSLDLDLSEKESSLTTLDGAKIVYTEGKSYQLIKIIEPVAMGKWVLDVTDNQSKPILDYTWMITSKTEIKMDMERIDDLSVRVSVTATDEETQTVKDFYESLTEKYITVTSKDKVESRYDLVYNEDGVLGTVFQVKEFGTYQVEATVTDGYFSRTCRGIIELTDKWEKSDDEIDNSENGGADKHEVHSPSDFGTIRVWKWFSRKIDLAKRTDVGLANVQDVNGATGYAELSYDDTVLHVHGSQPGKANLTVRGRTDNGSEIELQGNLIILNTMIPLFILIGFAVGGLIVRWFINRRQLYGRLTKVNVKLSRKGQEPRNTIKPLPVRRVLTLYDVVESYYEYVTNDKWGEIVLEDILKNKDYRRELKKAKLIVNRDHQSFKYDRVDYIRGNTQFFWSSNDGDLSISFNYE